MRRKGKIYQGYVFWMILLLSFGFHPLLAQQNNLDQFRNEFLELPVDDYRFLDLDQVLDSAFYNSRQLKIANLDIQEKQLLLNGARLDILKSLSLNANYFYGTNARFSSQETTTSDLSNTLSITESANYSVGVGLRLSIFDVLNRKNNIRINSIAVERLQTEKQVIEEALKELIITTYEQCQLKKRLIRLYESDLQSALLNLNMGKRQFENAEIPVADITKIIDDHSKATVTLETGKNELHMSLLQLSQLSGIPISSLIIIDVK